MSNLNKRILTSLPLSILAVYAVYNNVILILSLYIISAILIFEISNILKNIFKRNKINSFIFLNLFILYICLFALQIYFFLSGESENKQTVFLFILSICIFTDIGGYIFGNIFKGPKLTKISPNKTYAGMLGGFLLSLVAALIFSEYQNIFSVIDYLSELKRNMLIYVLIIVFISAISQIGDLAISYIKRLAKVKNTGKLLPGHGGLLDRFDGIIFAVPISYILIKYLI